MNYLIFSITIGSLGDTCTHIIKVELSTAASILEFKMCK